MDTNVKDRKDNKDLRDEHNEHLESSASHYDNVVVDVEPRQPYGPSGFKGLFASPYVAMCAAFSTLGGLMFGYDQGVVSVILVMPEFLEQFPDVANGGGFYKGLVTAMIELGALVGALFTGYIADKISRKYSIVASVIVFIIGGVLQTAAVNYDMLIVARLIGGLGIGGLSMIVPVYISEISPPEIRGSLLVLEEFSIVAGIVIAFWITYGTQYMAGEWAWRLPFLLQIVPAVVLGAGILFLPFSPRWLASKGRDEDALIALAKLRGIDPSDSRVRYEWCDIRAEVAMNREILQERHPKLQDGTKKSAVKLELAQWADLFKPGCIRRTLVGVLIMFFQQFVGINALIYYSPTLFETMGLNYDLQLIMSGVLNVCQLIGVSTSIYTMDRYGRRKLLLWGSFFMAVSHIVISGLVGKYSSNWEAHSTEGWISVAFLLFYMLAFGASWGPVPWAVPSEIFPSSLRAKGVGLATSTNWLNNFIIGLITPPLVENTGFGAYIFFAVFCVLSGIWVYFCVPETNGKTLEQMDEVFGDSRGQEEAERRARIEADIIAGSKPPTQGV